MALYKHKKSQNWWCRFQYQNREYRRSTGETGRRAAEARERAVRAEVEAAAPARKRPGLCIADLCGLDIERALAKKAEVDVHTIENRWKPLARILGASNHPVDVTFGDIESYVIQRRKEHIRGQTIRRELHALRRGMQLAKRKGWLSKTLEDWPEVSNDPKDELQAGKVHPLHVLAAWFRELPRDVADEVAFALLTGLRARELKRVEGSWLEICTSGNNAVLRIPAWASKTRRERLVGLSAPARAILAKRRDRIGPVFCSENHRRARSTAARKIGYHATITLRDLRHMFATFAVAGASPVHEVQRALGHTSVKTTELYLHMDGAPANVAPAAVAALLAPLQLLKLAS